MWGSLRWDQHLKLDQKPLILSCPPAVLMPGESGQKGVGMSLSVERSLTTGELTDGRPRSAPASQQILHMQVKIVTELQSQKPILYPTTL